MFHYIFEMEAMLLPLLSGDCILKFGKHPLHLYPLGNPIKTFTIFNLKRLYRSEILLYNLSLIYINLYKENELTEKV